jgi:hypothetical protein
MAALKTTLQSWSADNITSQLFTYVGMKSFVRMLYMIDDATWKFSIRKPARLSVFN